MLSKREKLFEACEELGGFVCPACGNRLSRLGDDLACEKGHRLNVNRKGCVNVLSGRVDSCYDAALFDARWRVLQSGCYDAIADAIEQMLPSAPQRILDAGCGEGWYLNRLLSRHTDWSGAGVDISRDAILRATDQPCRAVWCVADLRSLPFAGGAFTAVLDVLTPANYQEFRRVLTPDGLLLKVYPGSEYLREIREARGMPAYAEGKVDAYLRENAVICEQKRVTVTHCVNDACWRDFVWMTPLNQDLTEAEKNALAAQNPGCVTVDLHIAACRMENE